MVAHTLWLWLIVWLAEAVSSPGQASICDLGPCTCSRGKIQCDCSRSAIKEIVLEAKLLRDFFTSFISVANCGRLHVTSRAVSGLSALQQVSVTNIGSLTLEEQAFSWTTEDLRHSGLAVNISHCAIPEVPSYTFRGSLRDVLLTEVNVSRTRAFAFSAIDHADKLEFTRVRLAEVDPQTFKKFGVNFLMFIDSTINVFPTRTMVNVEVHQEVRLQNIKVGRLECEAFKMHGVQSFKLVKSTVDYIERDALHVHTKGDVSIHDNTFSHVEGGAFLGITLDSRYLRDVGKQDFVFENNTLVDAASSSLAFNSTGFDMRLDWIRMNQPCSCERVDSWLNDLVILYFNPNVKSSAPQVNTVIYCLDHKLINVKDYQRRNCEASMFSQAIKIILIVGAAAALVTIGTVVYCTVKKKGKRYINVTTSPSALRPAKSHKAHILVVPDGKTYRETELHVIVEHVEPIVPTEYVKERPDRLD